jgi:hypothetical protein
MRAPRHRAAAALRGLVAAAAVAPGGRLATGNPENFPMRELTVVHRSAGASSLARLYHRGMAVDVLTTIEIDRPRHEVAAYASDPDNATEWYEKIKAVEWKSSRPIAVGSKIAFAAEFLGRRLAYTYEVKELIVGERLLMTAADGPFPMETTYTWVDTSSGGTRMTLLNRGAPSGFRRIGAPLISSAMRRANRKDLLRLKRILEHKH